MKLKILAIVALAAVGVGAAFVAVGGLPASAASTTQYLTGAGDDRRRRPTTSRRPGPSPRAPRTAWRSGRRPTSPAATPPAGSTTWTVTDVKVEVGDTVKKGDVLATADTTDLKRQLADARTPRSTPPGSSCDRRRRASRTPRTPTSPRRSARRRSSVNNAEIAGSPTRRKTRDDLKAQIKLATLTAPIDGVVTAVNVVDGPRRAVRRRDRHRRHDLPDHGRRRRERPRRR